MLAALFLIARIIRTVFITFRFAVSLAVLGAGTLKWARLQRSF